MEYTTLFNVEIIIKILKESPEFREIFESLVRRIASYQIMREYPIFGKSAEKVFLHMEAIADNRHKIIGTLLYMNKLFCGPDGEKILMYIRNLDQPDVADDVIDAFFLMVWERDMLEGERIKNILKTC